MSDSTTGVVYVGCLGSVSIPWGHAQVDGPPLLVPDDVAIDLVERGDWELAETPAPATAPPAKPSPAPGKKKTASAANPASAAKE